MYSYTQSSLFGEVLDADQPSTIPLECTNEDARVYVSFTCQQDSEQLQEKH